MKGPAAPGPPERLGWHSGVKPEAPAGLKQPLG